MNIDEKIEFPEYNSVYYTKNNSLIIKNETRLTKSITNKEEDFSLLDKRLEKNTVVFNITPNTSCNFNCSYCYRKENSNKISFNEYKEIIDYIKQSNIDENKTIIFQLSYTGEPLEDPDALFKIISYIRINFKKCSIMFITNGYNMQLEKYMDLYKLGLFNFLISYDGSAQQEKDRDKKEIVEENIKQLVKNGIDVNISLTVKEDTDIWQAIEDCKKLGVEKVTLNILRDGLKNEKQFIENYKKFTDGMLERIINKKGAWFGFVDFRSHIGKLMHNSKYSNCSVKHKLLTFYKNGDVYDCNYSIGKKPKLGNIREGFNINEYLKEAEQNIDNLNIPEEKCSKCKYLKICGGSKCWCLYENKNVRCAINKLNSDLVLKIVSFYLNNGLSIQATNYMISVGKNRRDSETQYFWKGDFDIIKEYYNFE